MKHKVEIRDSVHDHMRREASWRSRCRVTVALVIFGVFLLIYDSQDITINQYTQWGGILVIAITLLTFIISWSERKRFNKTYEYKK